MFEHYTEKGRRAIFFARYEASEFGLHWIDSNCLLLGLVRENGEISTRWLGLDATELHRLVESQIVRSKPLSTSVDLPRTSDAKRVLSFAAEEAERLAHHYIGTEHLFLGLLRESDSFAAKRIKERSITIDQIRAALAQEEHGGGGGAGLGSKRWCSSQFQLRVVNEQDAKIAEIRNPWSSCLPAIGESLIIPQPDGGEAIYRVLDVSWRVTAAGGAPLQLSDIVLKVRKEQS
jgi:ATP-dependent Clp protease ATP-binding subunit ClpA